MISRRNCLIFFSDNSDSKIYRFGSILQEIEAEDYEELNFENRMKKKRKLEQPRKYSLEKEIIF